MSIRVRYFASLREQLGRYEDQIEAEGIETVSDVWAIVGDGKAMPNQIVYAVNMNYAKLNTAVKDGDEIAFFPPVTGG